VARALNVNSLSLELHDLTPDATYGTWAQIDIDTGRMKMSNAQFSNRVKSAVSSGKLLTCLSDVHVYSSLVSQYPLIPHNSNDVMFALKITLTSRTEMGLPSRLSALLAKHFMLSSDRVSVQKMTSAVPSEQQSSPSSRFSNSLMFDVQMEEATVSTSSLTFEIHVNRKGVIGLENEKLQLALDNFLSDGSLSTDLEQSGYPSDSIVQVDPPSITAPKVCPAHSTFHSDWCTCDVGYSGSIRYDHISSEFVGECVRVITTQLPSLLTCPANSTLIDAMCVCDEGFYGEVLFNPASKVFEGRCKSLDEQFKSSEPAVVLNPTNVHENINVITRGPVTVRSREDVNIDVVST